MQYCIYSALRFGSERCRTLLHTTVVRPASYAMLCCVKVYVISCSGQSFTVQYTLYIVEQRERYGSVRYDARGKKATRQGLQSMFFDKRAKESSCQKIEC